MTDVAGQPISPDALRTRLVDHLSAKQWIRSPAVEAAFRRVPRHVFVPDGVALDAAYADSVVITKRRPDGRAASSISAPWLQAYMLEAARLRPGSRVLEIGSGGYNAALIAEIVGPAGAVVSIDIDPEVVDNARAALTRAGYPQVAVVAADAEYGHPSGAPYDALIVTVEAVDIPPAWTDQLAPDGTLVVPLRMRGNTRCLTLTSRGDHLAASAAVLCGFVPMQGDGSRPVRRLALRGDDITLAVDDATEVRHHRLAQVFDRPRLDAWSPVTTAANVSFESLHLWLATQPHPFGLLAADPQRIAGLLDPQNKVACPTLFTDHTLAYLALRKTDSTTWQFGAHGFGPDAAALTGDMVDLITAWDRDHRHGPGPHITVHPTGSTLPDCDRPRLLVARRHTTTAVTWPPAGHQR